MNETGGMDEAAVGVTDETKGCISAMGEGMNEGGITVIPPCSCRRLSTN